MRRSKSISCTIRYALRRTCCSPSVTSVLLVHVAVVVVCVHCGAIYCAFLSICERYVALVYLKRSVFVFIINVIDFSFSRFSLFFSISVPPIPLRVQLPSFVRFLVRSTCVRVVPQAMRSFVLIIVLVVADQQHPALFCLYLSKNKHPFNPKRSL